MTIPLAESELQEISAAYEKAEQKISEAGEAMNELISVLKKRAAFVSNKKINQLRNVSIPVGALIFQLSVQRHRMIKYGAKRALR